MHVLLEKDKLYYSIGEVKEITGIESHVLRYWETEFPSFRPRKGRSGQRTYTRKDIDLIFEIKRLLYDEKFTIKGAKLKLKNQDSSAPSQPSEQEDDDLNDMNDGQLFLEPVEQAVNIQRTDKDFLKVVKDKLHHLQKELQKIADHLHTDTGI